MLGAKLLGIYLASGVEVVAEDLGTVPDFVRWSMARIGVPGFKVMRWERAWKTPDEPLIDPRAYPEISVALSGTHDTEAMAEWWAEAPAALRMSLLGVCGLAPDQAGATQPYVPGVRDAVLRTLLGSSSRLRHDSAAGRLRLGRPHQHAGDRLRRQLDVARAGDDRRLARVAGMGGTGRGPGVVEPRRHKTVIGARH